MKEIMQTLQYYERNSFKLIKSYNNADMRLLHDFMLQHIEKKNEILEIGFGSGRELEFLLKEGFSRLSGIEGCRSFIENAKKNFMIYHCIIPFYLL